LDSGIFKDIKVPAQLEENVKFDNRSYFSTVIGLAFRKLDVFGYFKFVTAVKNINLLPNRDNMIAQKKAKVFSNFAFKGVIGGLSIIYIVLFGLSFWNIKTYNDKLVDYDEVITAHELKTLENKKVQKDIALIVKALDMSKNIKSNKVINFRVLAQIASAVPKRVKFNSIEYDGSSQIVIEGGAFSDQDILKLISNLNNKKLIAQASLATMTLPEGNQQGKQAMKGFKVVCVLESI
jgi:type IV pilus assembly protein PilN